MVNAPIVVPANVKTVMAMLTRAAEAGETCPTNAIIAERIGAASRASAGRIFDLLENMNAIQVERKNCRRIVTIVATGKRTAGGRPAPRRPAVVADEARELRRVREREARRASQETAGITLTEKARPLPPSRDPCRRCGARPGLCGHGSAMMMEAQ